MNLAWYNLLGHIGVALVVLAYWMLQSGRWEPGLKRYSATNAVGAGLILVSLIYEFNLPAFLIEAFWLLISVYGLLRQRHTAARVD